jgi:hypothetical protein
MCSRELPPEGGTFPLPACWTSVTSGNSVWLSPVDPWAGSPPASTGDRRRCEPQERYTEFLDDIGADQS